MWFLLLPISLLYSIVIRIRHLLYDFGIIRSKSYDIPVICIGNLCLGGSGKTPHTEYLIRLLKEDYHIGVVSRGYKRATKGFLKADLDSTSTDIGDEPMQYKKFIPDIDIAVAERRTEGIERLLSADSSVNLILLDDAYQHRRVRPGYNILLTDYSNLYSKDYLLPTGTLRDIKSAASRANAIVISKSPTILSPYIKDEIRNSIKIKPNQKLFFSYIHHKKLSPLNDVAKGIKKDRYSTIVAFCGIAQPEIFETHLKTICSDLYITTFKDHYRFTERDIDKLINSYKSCIGNNKIMVTTEKDAMRLIKTPYLSRFKDIPLYYTPIEVRFHNTKDENFDEEIMQYVRSYQTNNKLHRIQD